MKRDGCKIDTVNLILFKNQKKNMDAFSDLPRRHRFQHALESKYLTNFYSIELSHEKDTLNHYHFTCEPEVPQDSIIKLAKIIRKIKSLLIEKIGFLNVRGNSIYGLKKKDDFEVISKFIENSEQRQYIVFLKFIKTIRVSELLASADSTEQGIGINALNISTKQRLKQMGLLQLGKGKFYTKQYIDFEKYFAFRGFKITACNLYLGIHLQVDVFTKIIRRQNVLEQVLDRNPKAISEDILQGAIVVAKYGNFRTYEIINIDFTVSPKSTFTPYFSNEKISYIEYYEKCYGVKIFNNRQPLLTALNKVQKMKRKHGNIQVVKDYIYLVPELVCLTGISEKDRKSEQMKQIIAFSKCSPEKRLSQIDDFIHKLNENHEGSFKIKQARKMNGFELSQPQFLLYNDKKIFQARQGELKISMEILREPKTIEQWIICYNTKNEEDPVSLINNFKEAGAANGIKFNKPQIIKMHQNEMSQFLQAYNDLTREINHKPEMIVFLLQSYKRDNFYKELKNFFSIEKNIPTQVVCQHQTKKKKGAMSYFANVAMQINTKVGGIPWEISLRNPSLSKRHIVTAALAFSKVKGQYCMAFVGTLNSSQTRIFSETRLKKSMGEFSKEILVKIMLNWLRTYYDYHNKKILPGILIFYREGISRAELSKESEKDIDSINQALDQARKKTKLIENSTEVIYLTVNKHSASRYFQAHESRQKFAPRYTNPMSGSVITSEMSIKGLNDFHLTPHLATADTTSNPSQFIICYHEPKITSEETIIEFTFDQCFNYYNWKGAIKYPSVLQNADKLSELAGKSMKEEITGKNRLCTTYHFL